MAAHPIELVPPPLVRLRRCRGHLADRGALKVLLSDLPGEPVTMPVTTLTLVAEWHDRREIRWDVLAEAPLGGRA